MVGVESIIGYIRDDAKTISDRDLSILNAIKKTHLNIRVNINDEIIKKLLKIKPDMITFVSPGSLNTIKPLPLNIENYVDQMQDYVADLRANSISSCVLIEPEISQVKLAGKIEFDYIELFAEAYTSANDLDQELSELDNIASLTVAANKLGLGVNISGGIKSDNIKELSRLQYLDDIIIDSSIIDRAISFGIEQAVRDLINQMVIL